jgi:hypothetical protein
MGPVIDQLDDTFVPSLHYRCLNTQAEFYASVEQIATWIRDGPLLQAPAEGITRAPAAPVTYPLNYPLRVEGETHPSVFPTSTTSLPATIHTQTLSPTIMTDEESIPSPATRNIFKPRRSTRKRKAPDFILPTFQGKAYLASDTTHISRKQRVPAV